MRCGALFSSYCCVCSVSTVCAGMSVCWGVPWHVYIHMQFVIRPERTHQTCGSRRVCARHSNALHCRSVGLALLITEPMHRVQSSSTIAPHGHCWDCLRALAPLTSPVAAAAAVQPVGKVGGWVSAHQAKSYTQHCTYLCMCACACVCICVCIYGCIY